MTEIDGPRDDRPRNLSRSTRIAERVNRTSAARDPDGAGHSGLRALCLGFGVVELALFVGAVALIQGQNLPATVAGLGAYRLVLVVFLSAGLPACYAVFRDGATLSETPRIAVGVVRADGIAVLGASLVARMLAIVATLAVFAVFVVLVLGVDTLVVWSDALLGVGVDRPTLVEWGVLAAGLAAAWLVNGLVDYQDLLVIDGRTGITGAWKASVSAVLSRPRWYPWQALVRGLLLAAPWALTMLAVFALDAAGVPDSGPATAPILLALAVLFVGVLALARASLVAYHVETMDDVVGPALASDPTPVRDNLGRIAVAGIVVLAAVGGVAAVRAGDVTPAPDSPDATLSPGDPAATMEAAIVRTHQRPHAKAEVVEQYNETVATWERSIRFDSRVDRHNARALTDVSFGFGDDERQRTLFVTDGAAAARGDNGGMHPNRPLHLRDVRSPWIVLLGYSFDAYESNLRYLGPEDTAGWSLRTANDSTLVYVMEAPADFQGLDVTSYAPDPGEPDVTYHEESELRAVVDRENATLERIVRHVHYTDRYDEDDVEERNVRTTITYRDVGDVTVERPDTLGGPGPIETAWDVVYYA